MAGQIKVSSGSTKATSFDLKVTHVQAEGEDKVAEQQGVKFVPGKLHTIQSSATTAGGKTPFKIATKPLPPPPRPPTPTGATGTTAAPTATGAKPPQPPAHPAHVTPAHH